MRSKLIAIGIITLVAFASCRKGNTMSKIPKLSYLYSTTEVKAGNSEDTIKIFFRLEDGDANIRTDGDDRYPNLFISNSRDTIKFDYAMPFINDEFKDPAVGLKADCMIQLPAAFFLLRDTSMTKDSIRFTLSIEDEAKNRSNEITTSVTYLLK